MGSEKAGEEIVSRYMELVMCVFIFIIIIIFCDVCV